MGEWVTCSTNCSQSISQSINQSIPWTNYTTTTKKKDEQLNIEKTKDSQKDEGIRLRGEKR